MIKKTTALSAERRFREIPKDVQEKILAKVYCVLCQKGTPIKNYTMEEEKGLLVIRGSCSVCSGEVARVVEEPGS